MMAWIKADSGLAYHPKVEQLMKVAEITRVEAIGHLVFLWWWCTENAPTGILPKLTDWEIAAAAKFAGNHSQFVAGLKTAGFLDHEAGSGLKVHDWDQWMSDPVYERNRHKQRKNSGKTAEKQRKNSGISAAPPSVDSVVVLSFPVSGEPKDFLLKQNDVDRLKDLYPGVDILAEAKKALYWVETNPTRKKTARGMPKFLAAWMERTQNKRGGLMPPPSMNTMEAGRKAADGIIEQYRTRS